MIDVRKLAIAEFNTPPIKEEIGHFVVDPFLGTLFLTKKLYDEQKDNIVIYVTNNYEGSDIYSSLKNLIDEKDIIFIPSEEMLRTEYISESKDLLAEQIYGLYSLINAKHKVIILPPTTLFKYYPTKERFIESSFKIKKGEEYNLTELKEKLIHSGYFKVSKIDSSMQFASRGDILDIYSLNDENPIRIEFFDTVIESIRHFNISTQVSYEEIEEALILPGTLNLLSDEEKEKGVKKISEQMSEDSKYLPENYRETLETKAGEDIDRIQANIFGSSLYKYYSFIADKTGTILDYIGKHNLIIYNENLFHSCKNGIFEDAYSFLNELTKEGKAISGLSYFNRNVSIYKDAEYIYEMSAYFKDNSSKVIGITTNFFFSSRDVDLIRLIEFYKKGDYKIVCFVENKEQLNKVIDVCSILNLSYKNTKEYELSDKHDLSISICAFPKGFEFKEKKIVVLTAKELFGYRRHPSTYASKFREGIILNSYQDLEPGDYVVHEKNGIGRFVEISTLEMDGVHEDYLKIQYDGKDVLFVPLYQFNLVRKYVGKDGYAPKLNKLYSKKWENTKKRIKERINDLAERLLALYGERAKVEGFSFKSDGELEKHFYDDFDHELTKDQIKSVDEILKDMESPTPMDRLLCGDVGFGKTEVAFRAVFRSIINYKMVIFLCPTTLLARQHYEVAMKRFKNFELNIALYTRACTPGEAKNIERNIRDNKIHLLIGTHKALSSKIDLSNLGLLIIDEEQRFGVEQKEKIKEKCKNIDVLTLSATPIPRTLQSSLIGLKSVSTIETPPKERVGIQTYVIPYEENVIKELIKRELSRRGQIFYVHNEIITIYETCDRLLKLVPECRIGIVHGKMSKDETNSVMQDFYDGNIDLLLATSIIENGIDVENANLMLIENANNFGLAQLYQIKGRVGRGDRMAFAYLLIDDRKEINEVAQKRLKAIQDFTALGSGYKIAQRDLLIRGAGDILGPEQAGFIDAIGIDMYIKLLNDTIEEKKQNILKAQEIKIYQDLGVDGYIPSNYIPEGEKVEVYQKLLNTNSIESLMEYKQNIRDIYGKLPENMELLFVKRKIDLYMEKEEFDSIKEFKDHILLKLSYAFTDIEGIGTALFTALVSYLKEIKISLVAKQINLTIYKKEDWVSTLVNIIEIIDELYFSSVRVKELYEN